MVQTIYIDPNTGNLGIGTTAAKQALDITNNLSVGGFIGIGTTTEFSSAGSSLGLFITKDISVGRGAGGYIGENMYWTGSQWQRYNTNAGGFAFRIGSSSDGYGESFQLLTINTTGTTTLPAMVCANGNLGIGTTNPTGILGLGANGASFPLPSGNAPLYGVRAWVNFRYSAGVIIQGSGNVSSITRTNAGDYTINLTTALPTANYAVTFGAATGNGRFTYLYNGIFNTTADSTRTTSSFRILYADNAIPTPVDPAVLTIMVIC